MESRIWKKTLKTHSKVWEGLRKAGVMQGDSRRVEQMNGKGGAKIQFSSHGLTLSGSRVASGYEPAASAQVAGVVREYSSITEALLGWGLIKKQDWQLIFGIHSLSSPFKLPRMRDSSLGEPDHRKYLAVWAQRHQFTEFCGVQSSLPGLIPSPVITLPWRNPQLFLETK